MSLMAASERDTTWARVVPERAQRRLIVPLDAVGGGGHAVQP